MIASGKQLGLRNPFLASNAILELTQMIVNLVDIACCPVSNLVEARDAKAVEDTVELWPDAFDDQQVIRRANGGRNAYRSQRSRTGNACKADAGGSRGFKRSNRRLGDRRAHGFNRRHCHTRGRNGGFRRTIGKAAIAVAARPCPPSDQQADQQRQESP